MTGADGDSGRARYPRPRKRLGQHFLTDPRILGRIADALELRADETVVEIGPGRGALTELLAARAGRVIAVELDGTLAALLRERFAARGVTVLERDVLDVSFGELAGADYALAGNVPYYITTPILFRALERPRPSRAVFLVQREVAERVVAAPGTKTYGALSVNVQAVARPEMLFRVAAGSFNPPPKVESAVVRVLPRADPAVAAEEEAGFRRFVQDAFGLRRKQMRRVLRTVTGLAQPEVEGLLAAAAIDPDVRPETLSPESFAAAYRAVRRLKSRDADD